MSKLKGKARSKSRQRNRQQEQRKFKQYQKDLRSRIRKFDDPVLKEPCDEVGKDEDLGFLADLARILAATDDGVGLAAPQIGITKRAIVVRYDPKSKDIYTMINPVIVEHGEEKATKAEGCLSYPGIYPEIERYTSIKVKYEDGKREEHEVSLKGYEARVAQHEIDHLSGICLVGEVRDKTTKKQRMVESGEVKSMSF
tara:strand:+ start:7369 stop:7962 length:594 start_codon:yes stop_codon:yes gene_type:complete